MDWDWAVGGVTNETPRTMGPDCENYLTDRRRWTEAVLFCILFTCIIIRTMKNMEPMQIPDSKELEKPHSSTRLILLLIMTFTFGIEMGFKFANKSVIFVLNPCHIQTLVQVYLLAAKPNKFTITLFRIQMNNLNGPFLAFMFPEVECRTLPFEQATYWIQHGMLYIIPAYILRTGAYQVEDIKDFNWAIIGVQAQLLYHFGILNFFSIRTGINLNHMLCAAESDPFQGENYRIAAVIHESILCPILNKITVLIFGTPKSIHHYGTETPNIQHTNSSHQQQYSMLKAITTNQKHRPDLSGPIFSEDGKTTTKLIHRKSNLLDYQEHHHIYQHQLLQHEINKKVVPKDDHIPETNDLNLEPMPLATATVTAEYTMPTTKID